MREDVLMSERTCPFGHTCAACLLQTTLRGINPQTGAELDNVGCALAFLPVLLVENSNQQRQTAAAVESFRNEMINGNDLLLERLQ
jgi:hypothetical protein